MTPKIDQLANQLQIGKKAATEFKRDVVQLTDRDTTYLEILQAIDTIESFPVTPQAVARVLVQQDMRSLIATTFDLDDAEANAAFISITNTLQRDVSREEIVLALNNRQTLCTTPQKVAAYLKVRQRLNQLGMDARPVEHVIKIIQQTLPRVTLESLQKLLDTFESSLTTIDELIDYLWLDQHLRQSSKPVHVQQFSQMVRAQVGYSVSFHNLRVAVENDKSSLGVVEHVVTFLRTEAVLRDIARLLNRVETQHARAFVQAVQSRVRRPVTVEAIRDVVARLSPDGQDSSRVAQELDRIYFLDVLANEIAPANVQHFIDAVLSQIHGRFPLSDLLATVQEMDAADRTPNDVAAYARIRIALQHLPLADRSAAQFIDAVRMGLRMPVTYPVVAEALERLEPQQRRADAVIKSIRKPFDIERIAHCLGITAEAVPPMLAEVHALAGRRVSLQEVIQALTDIQALTNIDPPQMHAVVLGAYFKTMSFLGPKMRNSQGLRSLIHKLQQRVNRPITFQELVQALQRIPKEKHSLDEVSAYLMLTDRIVETSEAERTGESAASAETCIPYCSSYKSLWFTIQHELKPLDITHADVDYLGRVTFLRSKAYFAPDIGRGEYWLTQTNLKRIISQIPVRDRVGQIESFAHFCKECWTAIRSTARRYQVPSAGRAEIEVSSYVQRLMPLHRLRFVQEHRSAPSVLIQFTFRNPARVGVVEISQDGTVTGFHHLVHDAWFRGLIEMIALSYYRDLVVPVEDVPTASRTPGSRAQAGVHHTVPDLSARPLPRAVGQRQGRMYSFHDWYGAQAKARHYVTGHKRLIGPGFVADDEKRRQALLEAVTLQDGYTWVLEHERGSVVYNGLRLLGVDLAERTLFTAPQRASEEIEQLVERRVK